MGRRRRRSTLAWESARRGRRRTGAIGKPIANTKVYVLDGELEPAPVGVMGRSIIGGAGWRAGIWDEPELTAEKFVPDPYGGRRGREVYRTGDVGGI